MKTLVCLLTAILVASSARAEVRTNIAYANPTNGTDCVLDVGMPAGAGPFPIVLYIHGGGWASGDKQEVNLFTNALAQVPAVWFSINYRLAPTNRWPACFEDVQQSIRWVKAHAAEFKGDPNRITLMGYSAGGHLACHAAVLAGDDTRVQAVVAFAGPTDHVADSERRNGASKSMQMLFNYPESLDAYARERLREISPLNYIRPGLPPFLLFAGTEDKSVPYSQSVNFQARLAAAQVACDLITITNVGHRLSEWKNHDPTWPTKLTDWLRALNE
jgi:alpha-L-fucosidase 2